MPGGKVMKEQGDPETPQKVKSVYQNQEQHFRKDISGIWFQNSHNAFHAIRLHKTEKHKCWYEQKKTQQGETE